MSSSSVSYTNWRDHLGECQENFSPKNLLLIGFTFLWEDLFKVHWKVMSCIQMTLKSCMLHWADDVCFIQKSRLIVIHIIFMNSMISYICGFYFYLFFFFSPFSYRTNFFTFFSRSTMLYILDSKSFSCQGMVVIHNNKHNTTKYENNFYGLQSSFNRYTGLCSRIQWYDSLRID